MVQDNLISTTSNKLAGRTPFEAFFSRRPEILFSFLLDPVTVDTIVSVDVVRA